MNRQAGRKSSMEAVRDTIPPLQGLSRRYPEDVSSAAIFLFRRLVGIFRCNLLKTFNVPYHRNVCVKLSTQLKKHLETARKIKSSPSYEDLAVLSTTYVLRRSYHGHSIPLSGWLLSCFHAVPTGDPVEAHCSYRRIVL